MTPKGDVRVLTEQLMYIYFIEFKLTYDQYSVIDRNTVTEIYPQHQNTKALSIMMMKIYADSMIRSTFVKELRHVVWRQLMTVMSLRRSPFLVCRNPKPPLICYCVSSQPQYSQTPSTSRSSLHVRRLWHCTLVVKITQRPPQDET